MKNPASEPGKRRGFGLLIRSLFIREYRVYFVTPEHHDNQHGNPQ
jgi:hypothetical protein